MRANVRAGASALSTITAFLLLGATAASAQRSAPQPPASMPLLETRGPMIGTTRYGSADLPPEGDPVRERLEEAAAAGLGGFTLYLDWPALEPEPGVYAFERALSDLEDLQALGLQTFANITVGDIGEYVVPDEFADGAGGLAPGVRLDAPVVIDRFGALLDRLVPELVARGVFALAVGNEIDDRLDADSAERVAYRSFVDSARRRIDAMVPDLPVGVTLTSNAYLEATATRHALEPVTDFLAVNYAPIDPLFFVRPTREIAADFERVMASMPPGPILIQELTCPNPESMNASLAWQADCFGILLDSIATRPRVRFASVFTLEDFDGELCTAVQEALGSGLDDVPDDYRERFLDYLCGLGVVDADGTAHPAWMRLIDFLRRPLRDLRRQLLRGEVRAAPRRGRRLKPDAAGGMRSVSIVS